MKRYSYPPRLRIFTPLCWLILSVAFIQADDQCPTPEPPPVRMEIELVDGSRILGETHLAAVAIRTPYATVAVPVELIVSAVFADQSETLKLELAGGDRITGAPDLQSIPLNMLLGEFEVGIELISSIRVQLPPHSMAESGLVLHYRFDQDEGGRVTDFSAHGNHGQVRGAEWMEEPRRGGYLRFDGRQALVNAGTGSSLDITRDLTITAWIRKMPKTFGAPHQLQVIVGKDNGPDWPGRSFMLFLLDHDNRPGIGFSYGVAEGGTDGRHDIIAYGTSVSDGKWHHLAIVHATGVGNTLYLNGRTVASDREGSLLPSNPQTAIMIGKTQAWEPWFYFGDMDDIMIHNRAFSAGEVKQVYDAQK